MYYRSGRSKYTMNATTQDGHISNVYMNVMCTFELYMFNAVVIRGHREKSKDAQIQKEKKENNDDNGNGGR